jgi:hypothetical protein
MITMTNPEDILTNWKNYATIIGKEDEERLPIQLGLSIVADGYVKGKSNGVFTHFHSDHMKIKDIESATSYDKILLHKFTYKVATALKPTLQQRMNIKQMEYGQQHTTKFGEVITLYDADHVLGSSQIHVSVDNLKILYSGDFVFPSADTPKCDILVLDASHGLPQFNTPTEKDSVLRTTLKEIKTHLETQSIVISASRGSLQELMNYLDEGNDEDNISGEIPFLAKKDNITIKNALYGAESKVDRQFMDYDTPEAYKIRKYGEQCIIFTTEQRILEPEEQTMYWYYVDRYNFSNDANISEHTGGHVFETTGEWKKDDNGNEIHKNIGRINLSGHTTYDGLIDYVDKNEPQIILVDSSRGKHSVELASDLTKKFTRPGISIP